MPFWDNLVRIQSIIARDPRASSASFVKFTSSPEKVAALKRGVRHVPALLDIIASLKPRDIEHMLYPLDLEALDAV